MRKTIKEIGTINIDHIEVAEGQIEMRIPVEIIGQQMHSTIEKFIEDFSKKNPMTEWEKICYEVRLVFSFNRLNPEFSLMVIIFDCENQDNAEIWDELDVTLSDKVRKQIKKITWNKLGEAFFNL